MRRARPRASWMLIVLSVVLAAVATLALRGHLARLEARARAAGPGGSTLVASSNLDRGTVIQAGMLAVEVVPDRYRPPGALAGPEQAVGRILAADVVAGEPLTAARIAPPGGPVAALVPDGFRAFTVASTMPPGAVVAGDRVDVLATFATGQPYTETVVSAAEVLMVLAGRTPDELGAGTTVVVLLVTSEVAERLAYARTFAELALAVAPAVDGS